MGNKGGSFWDNPFGGMFDYNNDGIEDSGEQWLGYKILEESTKEKERFNDDISDFDCDDDEDTSWREFCEYDSEFGVDPNDYATEEEYEDALKEAKYGWRDICEDGSEFDVDPEDYETEDEYNEALNDAENNATSDSSPSLTIPIQLTFSVECPTLDRLDAIRGADYPNKRQYEAAYTLADGFIYSDKETEQKQKAVSRFILEHHSTVIAANYLTVSNGFLFAQAVKDHFTLPVDFPDEDEEKTTYFSDMIRKIARKDIGLSVRIWDWCIKQFMPYAHFEWCTDKELTCETINDLYRFPKKFRSEFVQYLGEHPDFCHALFRDAPELADDISELIYIALQSGRADISKLIFEDSLVNANKDTDTLINLISGVISWCSNLDELESMELFQRELFPLVLKFARYELEEEIDDWEKEMAEYIRETEQYNEKYAFSRCNSWRKSVPDGKKYGLNVCNYDTEKEYLNRLHEKKYGWRSYYDEDDCLGLNPSDFETQREFDAALRKQRIAAEKADSEQRRKEQEKKAAVRCEMASAEIDVRVLNDKKIYIYCGVVFHQSRQVYHYRTDDKTIEIGDSVIVPVGIDSEETEATIVSVGQYARTAVPFPVEKTRFILRKVEKEK